MSVRKSSKCLKHAKTVFININLILLDSPLIKTPRLLMLDTTAGPTQLFRASYTHVLGTEEYILKYYN